MVDMMTDDIIYPVDPHVDYSSHINPFFATKSRVSVTLFPFCDFDTGER